MNQLPKTKKSKYKIQTVNAGTESTTKTINQQTQAINDQTKAIKDSSKILTTSLQKSIQQGIQEYDEISKKNNELLTNLVNSNQVDSSIVKTISNLVNDKKANSVWNLLKDIQTFSQ